MLRPKAKRSDAEYNQNEISNGVAAEQLTEIFKLDIDCLNEAMDYLPTKYLATVGQTCKRLRQKAGYIFNQNYPSAIVNVRSDEANYFPQYIQSIEIKSRRDFNRFVWKQKKFYCLKQLLLADFEIKEANVERIKSALSKVTTLCLNDCKMSPTTFEKLIDSCPNIKHLRIMEPDVCNPPSWFRRKYPTLESVGIYSPYYVIDLSTFLELNPNIKRFSTDIEELWREKPSIKRKNIKLNELIIDLTGIYDFQVPEYCNFLNELYECQFFKRLYLNYDQMGDLHDAESATQLISIKGLAGFMATSSVLDEFNILPNYFANIEHVHLETGSCEHLMLLITSSTRLKHISVERFVNIVNLSALNEVRQKMALASPLGCNLEVTIFIEEEAYLATKWAYKGNECGLICIRRLMEYNQNNGFTYLNENFNR